MYAGLATHYTHSSGLAVLAGYLRDAYHTGVSQRERERERQRERERERKTFESGVSRKTSDKKI
jgi:hypothetical protein